MTETNILRASAELRYRDELERLRAADTGKRPEGWHLSPRAVRRFILGDVALDVSRKFYGDDPLVDRAIVTLMGHQGLMLVGEPGTAKSLLSELLSAAIGGDSALTIQGTAGTTEDHIKYSWNYALLLAEGPSLRAMVPSPLYQAMVAHQGDDGAVHQRVVAVELAAHVQRRTALSRRTRAPARWRCRR